MNQLPKRKKIRWNKHDYSACGVYFVTICVEDRKELLSKITVGTGLPDGPQKNAINTIKPYGKIAEKYIKQMDEFYDHISVDKYVIMPNHIHLLLRVTKRISGPSRTPVPTDSAISKFVGTFKRFCNKEYGGNIWQPRSFDHVVRDEQDYWDVWKYIDSNVKQWQYDKLNSNIRKDPLFSDDP